MKPLVLLKSVVFSRDIVLVKYLVLLKIVVFSHDIVLVKYLVMLKIAFAYLVSLSSLFTFVPSPLKSIFSIEDSMKLF